MSDLISRKDAINAIVKMPFKIDADGYNWVLRIDALKELEDIPSANSEQVVTATTWITSSVDGVSELRSKYDE